MTGLLSDGLIYRSVTGVDPRSCEVAPREFSCTVSLPPARSITLGIRVLATTPQSAAAARQRIQVRAPSAHRLDNTVTSSSPVTAAPHRTTATAQATLSDEIRTFPGVLIPLLALLMLALAAGETPRRSRSTDAKGT